MALLRKRSHREARYLRVDGLHENNHSKLLVQTVLRRTQRTLRTQLRNRPFCLCLPACTLLYRASHGDRLFVLKIQNSYSSCFDGSTFSWPVPTRPHASRFTNGSIYTNCPKHLFTHDSKGETQKCFSRTLPSLQPTRSRRHVRDRA